MKIERIDDLGVLSSVLKDLQISKLFDEHFKAHGNWRGISLGSLASTFLLYVLSEGDHRLSHIEDWSAERSLVLGHFLGENSFSSKDCTDDRLGALLDYLSDDSAYQAFELALNQHIVKVYALPLAEDNTLTKVHLDATIAQTYGDASALLSVGYAKHRRPDLVQTKVMLGTLGVLGMPLCVEVVNGATPDDGLYIPMVERVRQTLVQTNGLLFIGDSKMGSIATRSHIAVQEHYYLCPMSRVQCPLSVLKTLLTPENCKQTVVLNGVDIPAFEVNHDLTFEGTTRQERRIVAFSQTFALSQTTHFKEKLNTAEEKINDILVVKQGKTPIKTKEELMTKIEDILKKQHLTEFFEIEINTHTTETAIRKYGKRAAQTITQTTFSILFSRNTAAIDAHIATLGWRVYATNATANRLSTADALQAYKEEYKVEKCFNDLHHKIAPLMPIFLHKDNRIVALIRLLCIALKVHAIIEFNARKALAQQQQTINNIYPGNPARKTDQPTAQMLLRALRNITLVIIFHENQISHIQVSELSHTQQRICSLIGVNPHIYPELIQFLKLNSQINET